jgi:hypothetical protein
MENEKFDRPVSHRAEAIPKLSREVKEPVITKADIHQTLSSSMEMLFLIQERINNCNVSIDRFDIQSSPKGIAIGTDNDDFNNADIITKIRIIFKNLNIVNECMATMRDRLDDIM